MIAAIFALLVLLSKFADIDGVAKTKVRFATIKELTFDADSYTINKRWTSSRQLQCYGSICDDIKVVRIKCSRLKDPAQKHKFDCHAVIDGRAKITWSTISCESWSTVNSTFVVKGSCYLAYILQESGPDDTEPRRGWFRLSRYYHQDFQTTRPLWTTSDFVVVAISTLLLGVVGVILVRFLLLRWLYKRFHHDRPSNGEEDEPDESTNDLKTPSTVRAKIPSAKQGSQGATSERSKRSMDALAIPPVKGQAGTSATSRAPRPVEPGIAWFGSRQPNWFSSCLFWIFKDRRDTHCHHHPVPRMARGNTPKAHGRSARLNWRPVRKQGATSPAGGASATGNIVAKQVQSGSVVPSKQKSQRRVARSRLRPTVGTRKSTRTVVATGSRQGKGYATKLRPRPTARPNWYRPQQYAAPSRISREPFVRRNEDNQSAIWQKSAEVERAIPAVASGSRGHLGPCVEAQLL